MHEAIGFIYALSVLAAILCGVGTVIGLMMNGSRNYDLGGAGIVATIFFAALAWLMLYLAG
jgi:hypothetical protein